MHDCVHTNFITGRKVEFPALCPHSMKCTGYSVEPNFLESLASEKVHICDVMKISYSNDKSSPMHAVTGRKNFLAGTEYR